MKQYNGARGKEYTCQCKKCKRHGFDSWARKILWSRKWQPALVFLLRNPMDRAAWWFTVLEVTKNWT